MFSISKIPRSNSAFKRILRPRGSGLNLCQVPYERNGQHGLTPTLSHSFPGTLLEASQCQC